MTLNPALEQVVDQISERYDEVPDECEALYEVLICKAYLVLEIFQGDSDNIEIEFFHTSNEFSVNDLQWLREEVEDAEKDDDPYWLKIRWFNSGWVYELGGSDDDNLAVLVLLGKEITTEEE
jgi:hypothetical protein